MTHRFAAGLLQKLHRLLPFVLFVLLTHLKGGSLLLVFYVLVVGKVNACLLVIGLPPLNLKRVWSKLATYGSYSVNLMYDTSSVMNTTYAIGCKSCKHTINV